MNEVSANWPDKEGQYENFIKRNFEFLENEGMAFVGTHRAGGSDPRDTGLVASYSREDFKVKIGWSKSELSLTAMARFNSNELAGKERFVYMEPFVEFLTQGRVCAVVPYIKENQGSRGLTRILKERSDVFERHGFDGVVELLAGRIKTYFNDIVSAPPGVVQKYHRWMSE